MVVTDNKTGLVQFELLVPNWLICDIDAFAGVIIVTLVIELASLEQPLVEFVAITL